MKSSHRIAALLALAAIAVGGGVAKAANSSDEVAPAKNVVQLKSIDAAATKRSVARDALPSTVNAQIDGMLGSLDELKGRDENPTRGDLDLASLRGGPAGEAFGEVVLIPTKSGFRYCGALNIPAVEWAHSWCSAGFDAAQVRTLYRVSGKHGFTLVGLLPAGATDVSLKQADGSETHPKVVNGAFFWSGPIAGGQPVSIDATLAGGDVTTTPIQPLDTSALS